MTTENTVETTIVPVVAISEMNLDQFASAWEQSQTVVGKDKVVYTLEGAYEVMLDTGLHYRTGVALNEDEMKQVRGDFLKLLAQKTANKLKVDLTIHQSQVRQAALVTSGATRLENARKAKALKDGTPASDQPAAPQITAAPPSDPNADLVDPTAEDINSDNPVVAGAAALQVEKNNKIRAERKAAAGVATPRS